jgi:hypothetical protein
LISAVLAFVNVSVLVEFSLIYIVLPVLAGVQYLWLYRLSLDMWVEVARKADDGGDERLPFVKREEWAVDVNLAEGRADPGGK